MSVQEESAPVEVTLRGHAESGDGEYARAKVGQALAIAQPDVRHAHVVLERRPDPAVSRPARAEATVDVRGATVRAHAVASTMSEAVDELGDRLRRRLVQQRERTRSRHRWTGVASDHEWRHGDQRREPVSWFPRPVESREVVRQKSFAPAAMTLDEAAFEMDMLDHGFYLFTDLESGRPMLVHRLPDGRYGVRGGRAEGAVAPVTAEPGPPPLSDAEARTRLDAGDEPFVFFVDRDSGEGRVLYRRYDGHYGLITGG